MKNSAAVQFSSTGTRKTEKAKLSSLVLHTVFAQMRCNSKEIQRGQKMGNVRIKIKVKSLCKMTYRTYDCVILLHANYGIMLTPYSYKINHKSCRHHQVSWSSSQLKPGEKDVHIKSYDNSSSQTFAFCHIKLALSMYNKDNLK